MHLWLIGGMELKDAMHLTHGRSESGVDRIVREVSVLHHVPEHVDPETIDSAREPEAQHIVHCLLNGRIAPVRSEEHTSELQSLMRTSYAVFCLKKKDTPHTHPT